ncbi:MAG: FAD-dependent oxidoreductase, partial [Planctomycetales bacterium]|nr:FAD-dependent oxidoreductase [Planctomycetales bacterium]
SATRGAHASTRVSVTAMAMGEAAGVAAAWALKTDSTPVEIDGAAVRDVLTKVGSGPFTDA